MLLLLGVIGVAAATLYAMRVGGHVDVNDASLVGVETKIEQALARLKADGAPATGLSAEQLATMFKDTDEVVATFAADLTRKQVTLDYLQKNPFELFSPDGPKEVKTADQAALDQAKVARQKKLKAELDTMKLQSLMSGGATRLAVVAGKVVREGDQVGSFTVTGISSAGVLLTADGNTWTLTMEQPGEKKK
jgi:biotin carboxyl carrier protein